MFDSITFPSMVAIGLHGVLTFGGTKWTYPPDKHGTVTAVSMQLTIKKGRRKEPVMDIGENNRKGTKEKEASLLRFHSVDLILYWHLW